MASRCTSSSRRPRRIPQRSQIFLDLAETEKRHLKVWTDKLRPAASKLPADPKPSARVRIMVFLANRFGPKSVLPMISAMESSGFDNYMAQEEAGPPHGPR